MTIAMRMTDGVWVERVLPRPLKPFALQGGLGNAREAAAAPIARGVVVRTRGRGAAGEEVRRWYGSEGCRLDEWTRRTTEGEVVAE